jgi:hypothetical protein
MGKSSFARSGSGSVSKSVHARTGMINKSAVGGEVFGTSAQPSVPSNIPGAGNQGVPPASADHLGEFSRKGNSEMQPTIVSAALGQATYGPKVVGSVAREGGQIKLAPGQFRAWSHPIDPTPKASTQVLSPVIPTKVV